VIDRMMYLRLEEERMDTQAEEEEEDEYEYDEEDGGDYNDDGILENTAVGVEAVESPSTAAGGSDSDNKQPPIQALLVIDRKVDLVTPMLTPLTYEGLIDDVLQIQVGGCVSVKKSIVEPEDQNEQQNQRTRDTNKDPKVLLPLNDSDPLYTEVRDKHVEVFGSFLQNQAKALKESHSQFTNRETARDLSEIHQFVKQIPVFTRNLRSLKNHIHIAELVKSAAEATSFRQRWQTERSMLESESQFDTLEDLIASGEPPYRWLRLFCLQSLTSNGIKATRYESLRKEVVQTYGFEFLMVLNDMEKAGFLRKRETFFMDSMATSYSTLRKSLNLINAEVDPSNPDDPAYVSSGYAPITVRWVQSAMRGFLGLDEALKELPSSSGSGSGRRWIDIEQKSPPESLVEALKQDRGPSLGVLAKKFNESTGRAGEQQERKPVLLVFYVGGITYMEVAALRFLSKRPSFPYAIICCTTEIVNGETLLRSLSC
jgi:vacuolar protein sorting-associated protein 33A